MTALLDIADRIRGTILDEIPSYTAFAPTIRLPDGKRKGAPLQPMPSQACVLAKLDAGYRHIVICKPVQDGATTLSLVPCLRRAIREHQTVLLCYPTGDSAKDIWSTKSLPILRAYGGQDPKQGGGKNGGAARVVKLPGGGVFMLRSGGGLGESGQASVTGDAMLIDEYDDWPDMASILNVRKRIKESPDPLLIEACTIKDDENSKIVAAWELGTKSHLEYPCMSCGAYQALTWERVDIEACTCRCVHCDAHWTDAQRRQCLSLWRCVDVNPQATAFSIRWSCLDSPLTTMREEIHGTVSMPGYLSALRAQSAGDHSEMRSFFRDRLTRVYVDDIQTEEGEIRPLSPAMLADRSAAMGWARPVVDIHPSKLWSRYVTSTPGACDGAVVAVDVQGDRIYWSVIGYSNTGFTWDIAWGQERCRMRKVGNGVEPEPWGPGDLSQTLSRLDELLPELTTAPIRHRVMDTRYEGKELALWLRDHGNWRGLIGVQALTKPDPTVQEQRRRILLPNLLGYDQRWLPRLGRFEIVTERARERVHAGYRKSPKAEGAAFLPAGLPQNDHYLRHLCSWLLETDVKTKRTKWVQKQKRDDHLDCRSYATALVLVEIERYYQQHGKDHGPPTEVA